MSVQDVSSNSKHKFPYKWNLSDGYPTKGIEYHGTTVMTTFACGGGSSMGYKLAGYDVIAANDIDPQMAKVYKANHNPKQYFLCGIKELLERDNLPKVDVLDGSPPCSVFSMAGSREGAWQKDKMFREGQSKQILDDLFFDFIDLVEKMQPKVVIAENVKGMLQGHAKWYTREIVRRLKKIGYNCQVFLLNAARMGVPQKRERVFFIATKTDRKLSLYFNEPTISYSEIERKETIYSNKKCSPEQFKWWEKTEPGTSFSKNHPKNSWFNSTKIHPKKVVGTVAASSRLSASGYYHYKEPRHLYIEEYINIGSFPEDYNFLDIKPTYLIGMSVPPVMMAQVAHQAYEQLIKQV